MSSFDKHVNGRIQDLMIIEKNLDCVNGAITDKDKRAEKVK